MLFLISTCHLSGAGYSNVTLPHKMQQELTFYMEIKSPSYGYFVIQYEFEHAGIFLIQKTESKLYDKANHRIHLKNFTISDTVLKDIFNFNALINDWPNGYYETHVFFIDTIENQVLKNVFHSRNYYSSGFGNVPVTASIRDDVFSFEHGFPANALNHIFCECEFTSYKYNSELKNQGQILKPFNKILFRIRINDSIQLNDYFSGYANAYKYSYSCFFDQLMIFSYEKKIELNSDKKNERSFSFEVNDPDLSKPLNISGSANYYSVYRSYRNEYDPRPVFYSKLSVNNSVSFFGLPFNTNFDLNSDQYSVYHQNSFNFSFDHRQYMQNMNNLKTYYNLQNREFLKKEKNEIIELESKQFLLDRKIKSLDKKLNFPSGNNDVNFTNDSLPDTDLQLNKDKSEIQNLRDSLNYLNELIERKSLIYRLDSADLELFNADPDLSNLKTFYPSKYNHFFSNLQKFSLGMSYAFLTPLTLEGIPVKGLDMIYENEKGFLTVVGGKTISPKSYSVKFDENKAPEYDRNIRGTSIAYGKRNKNYISFNFSNVSNNKHLTNDNSISFSDNYIYSFSYQYRVNKFINLSGETGKSILLNENREFLTGSQSIVGENNFWDNTAYNFNLLLNPFEKSEFEFNFRHINANFINHATPFLISDLSELKLNYRQLWFKNKIRSEVTYSEIKDNTLQLMDHTNSTSGFGFMLSSGFSNLPNFYISYTPYIYSNNHYDPLYYTYSRFSVFTGIIHHNFNVKNSNHNISATYVHSGTILTDELTVEVNNISLNYFALLSNRFSINLHTENSITRPHVDSVNYYMYSAKIEYKLNQNISFMSGLRHQLYEHGGNLSEFNLGTGATLLKKMFLNINIGSGKINDLWGYEDHFFFSGEINIRYKW